MHPSSIFMNALVCSPKEETLRFSYSKPVFSWVGMSINGVRSPRNLLIDGTRLVLCLLPRIISHSLNCSISSGNACGIQPVSTITAEGLLRRIL